MATLADLSLEPKATKSGTLFRIPEREGIPFIKVKEVEYKKGYYLFVDKDSNYYITDSKFNYIITLKLDMDRVNELNECVNTLYTNVDTFEYWEKQEQLLKEKKYEYQRKIKSDFSVNHEGLMLSTDEEGLPIITKDTSVLFEFAKFIDLDNTYRFYEPLIEEDITNIERYDLGVVSQRIGNRVVDTTSRTRASRRERILNGEVSLSFSMIILGNDPFTEQFIAKDPSFVSERYEWDVKEGIELSLKKLGKYLGIPVYRSEILCNGTIPSCEYISKALISEDSDLDDLYNAGFMLGETMLFNPKYKDIKVNFQLDVFNDVLYIKRIKVV